MRIIFWRQIPICTPNSSLPYPTLPYSTLPYLHPSIGSNLLKPCLNPKHKSNPHPILSYPILFHCLEACVRDACHIYGVAHCNKNAEFADFILYDGFEPSGRMHIAQGVFKAMNVNKCTR